MGYTQDNHSIAIATPLGKDKLLLKSCVISEQLGRPFEIKAQLLSEEPSLNFLEIIGKAVTIRWRMPEPGGGEKKRYFNGYVSSFVQCPKADGFNTYEATIVPWLWFLTRTADCRIFHSAMSDPPEEMTVPGILKKVFKDHGFDDVTPALTGSYRKMDHCVQYRETDFNFVSRLMEQEGIYYFFEHVDDGGSIKHKLKLVDAMSAHSEYTNYGAIKYCEAAEEDVRGSIFTWSRIKEVQPGTFKVNDFDFKRPKTSLLGSGAKDRQYANSAFEIYDYPGNYADEDPGDYGDKYGKLRIEELQSQHDVLLGEADCPGLMCGCKFTLEGHPRDDENAEYLIVGVTYQCTSEAFKSSAAGAQEASAKPFVCDFAAIPADSIFRPARVTEKPRIQGPQTAIVVGKAGEEILTDEFGRIKVQFHWDRYSPANENSPCWVRVSQAWAGKNWGSVFLPRIGQEVIVEFLEGNPDRPIVTGAVYNGESKPPYSLPDNATISTIKSNSSKGGQGFNELRFEDKKGSEQVFMHAEKDQDIRVKNDAKEWIGKDRHLIVKANQRELIEQDKHVHVKADNVLKVDGNVGRTVAKDEIAKISGKDHLAVTGDYVIKVGGNLHEAVTGNHHEKATGDLRLTSDANAYVKSSQNAAVESGMNLHLKGGLVVVVEAGMQLSLKAGANFIDIGPAGISIQGTMVNINTGGAAASGSGAQAASPSSPNDPEAVVDASEAADAQAGSSVTKAAPSPPQAKRFSPTAAALKEAAKAGAPTVAGPASGPAAAPAATATNAAANAATATTAANNAAVAAAAAAAGGNAAAAAAAASTATNASTAASEASTAASSASVNAAAAVTGDEEDEDEDEEDKEDEEEKDDEKDENPLLSAAKAAAKLAKAAAKAAKKAAKAAAEAKAAAKGGKDKDDDEKDDDKDDEDEDDKDKDDKDDDDKDDKDKDDEDDKDKDGDEKNEAAKTADAAAKAAKAAAKAAKAAAKAADAAAKAAEAADES